MANLNAGAAPPISNYTEYYDDEGTNAFEGNYQGVMADYDLSGGGALSADELYSTVNSCASQRIPTAFLVLSTLTGELSPTIKCYHQLIQFLPRMECPRVHGTTRFSRSVVTCKWTAINCNLEL